MAHKRSPGVARVQEQVVGVRLRPEEYEAVKQYAERYGAFRKDGGANVSAALRTLIMLSLQKEGLGMSAQSVHLDNARAEWLEMVQDAWREAITRVSNIGLKG
jgi:hypothetical protein